MEIDEIINCLEKKARGGFEEETREEFVQNADDEAPQMIKRVVTKKYYLPDTQALFKLLELNQTELNIEEMSDEELQKEKNNIIIKMLNEMSDEELKEVFSRTKGQCNAGERHE